MEQEDTNTAAQSEVKPDVSDLEEISGCNKKDRRRCQNDPGIIYSCTKCEAKFKRLGALKKHQLKEHNIKLECNICLKSFMDFEAYQVHTKTHLTSFMCNNEKCGEVFPSQSKLVVHKNHKHGMGDKDEPCPYCAKCVFNLKTHIKDIHEGEFILCSKCEYSTRRKSLMDTHYKNVHEETVLKTCDICGGSFKRLDKHKERSHNDTDIKLQCETCDKTFKWKESLNKHIKEVHLKLKKQLCMHCGFKTELRSSN